MKTDEKLEGFFHFLVKCQNCGDLTGSAIRYVLEGDEEDLKIDLVSLDEDTCQINFYADGEEKNEQFSSPEEATEWLNKLVVYKEERKGTVEDYYYE